MTVVGSPSLNIIFLAACDGEHLGGSRVVLKRSQAERLDQLAKTTLKGMAKKSGTFPFRRAANNLAIVSSDSDHALKTASSINKYLGFKVQSSSHLGVTANESYVKSCMGGIRDTNLDTLIVVTQPDQLRTNLIALDKLNKGTKGSLMHGFRDVEPGLALRVSVDRQIIENSKRYEVIDEDDTKDWVDRTKFVDLDSFSHLTRFLVGGANEPEKKIVSVDMRMTADILSPP